jgi:hypothetical protein
MASGTLRVPRMGIEDDQPRLSNKDNPKLEIRDTPSMQKQQQDQVCLNKKYNHPITYRFLINLICTIQNQKYWIKSFKYFHFRLFLFILVEGKHLHGCIPAAVWAFSAVFCEGFFSFLKFYLIFHTPTVFFTFGVRLLLFLTRELDHVPASHCYNWSPQ